MAAFPHIVHHTSKIPDTDTYAVTRITPIIRVSSGPNSVYLQGGKVLNGGGDVEKNPPAWFYDEVAKLTPTALRDVGFADYPTLPTTAVPPAKQQKVGGQEQAVPTSKDKA